VLISGSGRTLANLSAAIDQGNLRARIGMVISSAPGVRGLDIAATANIPSAVLRRKDFQSDDAFSAAVYDALAPIEPDLIVMAGFLRRLVVTPAWEERILNIHPALLPEMASAAGKGFYGNRVHEAVLAAGATVSGATVHVVDNDYDSGPVVMKAEVPVMPDDTPESLSARVFEAECRLYPQAISSYLERMCSNKSSPHPHRGSGD
jgi:phosphoribosylglycinamide formyltransferase 1